VDNDRKKAKIVISNRRYLIGSLIFLTACALITAFIMEWRARAGDAGEALNFATHNIRPFLIEALVLLLLMLLISSLLGDAILGSGLVFAAFVVMTFVHVNKMAARNEPFIPVDFTFIFNVGDVASMTKPMDNAKQIVLIAAVLIVCVAVSVLLRRRAGVKQLSVRRLPRVRIAAFAFSVVMLLTLTYTFMFPKDLRTFEAKIMGFDFNDWDQSVNYKQNGFIIGFLYNMAIVRMDQPAGYSREKIQDIVEKYEQQAAAENAKRTDPADSDVNIVYIMNESFCNPNGFKKYFPYTGGNAVPNVEKIAAENPSGYVVSPAFGGGTALVEFEGITGFSNWFHGVTLPYHFSVKKRASFPSVASYLKNKGYHTVALHPYSGLMYDRRSAFKAMGFDDFTDKKEFTYTAKDRTGLYISDRSAYRELLKSLADTDG
jgi:phosphoglycerol transferase MdoB-like AlkP superfamily enzyme